MFFQALGFVLALLLVETSAQCENDQTALQYEIVESLLTADIIVVGEYTGHEETDGHFMVSCMLKANGVDIPENITLRNAVGDECSATKLVDNTRYILMLSRNADTGLADKDTFSLSRATGSTAAFEATAQNLQKASNICSVKSREIRAPMDQTNTKYSCPKRTATSETCLTEDVTDGSARVTTYSLCLLIVSTIMLML